LNLKGRIFIFKISALSIRIFIFSLIFNSASGQVFYSVNPSYLKAKAEGNNNLTVYHTTYPDTTIGEIHNYFPRNFLGNLGLPSPGYILKYGSRDMGFSFYPNPYSNDLFTSEQAGYYRSIGP
jgi:hypothetical protein